MHYTTDLERALGQAPRWYHYFLTPLVTAGPRAVLSHRFAAWFAKRGHRVIASAFKRLGLLTTGAEISQYARIGPGLRFPHPQGVVIGPGVIIEGDCTIFQSVTVGPRRADATLDDVPTLGVQTFLYAGARVLGRIRIGERTQVGPNCVVFTDLADGSTVLPPRPVVMEGLSFSLRDRDEAGSALDSAPDSTSVPEGAA